VKASRGCGWKVGRIVGKEGEWLVTKVSGLKSNKDISTICEERSVVLTIDEWLACKENG
jgi:hypothetical protein